MARGDDIIKASMVPIGQIRRMTGGGSFLGVCRPRTTIGASAYRTSTLALRMSS